MFDESFAGMVPEIVTAREAAMAEEMSRGDLDFEFDVVDTDGDGYFEFDDMDAGEYCYEDYFDVDGDFYEETAGDYAEAGFEDGGFDDSYEEAYDWMEDGFAEEGFVEEAVEEAGIEEDGFAEDFPMENEAESEAGSETGAEAESTVESDSSDVTEEKWSLEAVRAEDVSVYFQLPVRSAEGEENGYVIGSSRVAGFQNNNDGSIGLSFACVTGDADSRIYTIRFAGADAYTAVMVHPADTMAQDAEADSSSEAAQYWNRMKMNHILNQSDENQKLMSTLWPQL